MYIECMPQLIVMIIIIVIIIIVIIIIIIMQTHRPFIVMPCVQTLFNLMFK